MPDLEPLLLDDLRGSLIRQEETIIFALIERAQFKLNPIVYQPGGCAPPGFPGSFCEYLLYETEKVHARVRRYTSPDEHPFCRDLPAPVLPLLAFPPRIRPTAINLNDRLKAHYVEHLLPGICAPGDDQNYGSSAVCDVACLQALSKRIHYGKFIAEAKFQQDRAGYAALIRARDRTALLARLTDAEVEANLLKRVAVKAAAYGQEIGADARREAYKIAPARVAAIYEEFIIPLTKDVEVLYLLERLERP
jgi:chorismate mutase